MPGRDFFRNLFEIYEQITGENPYKSPMRIYPAPHYTMGGLWVDYNLMTTIPGLFALGEANFSDHGANRLGASALMQGLADGYFVIPYTLGNYLASVPAGGIDDQHAVFTAVEKDVDSNIRKLVSAKGRRSPESFHRQLGRLMWDACGMSRTKSGLEQALNTIGAITEEFNNNLIVPGSGGTLNQPLEQAGRVQDFLEFAKLMCVDALQRDESCGGHFREEYQTSEGEALRNDENFCYVSAWSRNGSPDSFNLTREYLNYESVSLTQRSYK